LRRAGQNTHSTDAESEQINNSVNVVTEVLRQTSFHLVITEREPRTKNSFLIMHLRPCAKSKLELNSKKVELE